MTCFRLLTLLLLALPIPAAGQTVSVGVIDTPPYVIQDPSGTQTGLAVDLFRLAAERAGLDYALVALPSGTDPADALEGHRIVLPVFADAEMEALADFSHPLHTATLGVAQKQRSTPLRVVGGLLTFDFLRIILGVALLLLIVGALVWLIERRRNEEMFHRDVRRGLGDGFWWAGVTLTTIGYGDKAPASFWGRAVAMVWMLVGLAVSASLTATVVTLADEGSRNPDLPEDLDGREVLVLEGGPAGAFVEGRALDATLVDDVAEALARVAGGEADAVLGAAPILSWIDEREGHGLAVRTTRWDPVLVGMVYAEGDPLREALDRAILPILASEAGQDVVRRYLPDE